MNQKQIGAIIIIISLALAALVFMFKAKEDKYIDQMIFELGGSCYLSDGTCLHSDRDWVPYILGWAFAGALGLFGVYMAFFDRTQESLAANQVKIAEAVRESKKNERFEAFLSGFNEDEQKVLKTIRSQEGILQSTLRYKAGLSKAALSLMIKSLEERGIVSKTASGKTNKIYLKKTF